jgi:glycosyltransferase involved in cell wall biosynthesis
MPREPISACLISHDEADRIGDCLDSLAFCDEIVVVDSHSSDATRELCRARGARVVERDWPGYAEQKDFAVRTAQHDWVLCVDCDERVSPALRTEIEALRERGFGTAAGYRMPRLSTYLGREIRHGSWYPNYQLRLFDRRRGRWQGAVLHERVALDGACETLRGNLLHLPYRDLADHLATIDRYTTLRAEELASRGRSARITDWTLRPLWRFLRFYFIEAGCLDGWRGLLLAQLAAHYVRLKYAKLWLLRRGSSGR